MRIASSNLTKNECRTKAVSTSNMSIIDKVPASMRRAARRILPASAVDAARDSVLHRFYLKSMVSRDSRATRWVRRRILRKRPRLYHFEIHITDHCNLNCKGCAHFSNLCKPTFADLGEFERDMRAMSEIFSAVDQVYLLGGEPLLHPDVASFVRAGRKFFPASRLYLMTNGTLVTRMKDEVWSALADTGVVLLCDAYPIGLPVEEINQLGAAHGAKIEWTVPREEFYKIPIDLEGGHEASRSFHNCQGFNNCPIVRDGRLYPCAYIAYADAFQGYFDIEGLNPSEDDSISILDATSPDAVMEFLLHEVPWCSRCDMDSREFRTWGRSTRNIEEWTTVTSER